MLLKREQPMEDEASRNQEQLRPALLKQSRSHPPVIEDSTQPLLLTSAVERCRCNSKRMRQIALAIAIACFFVGSSRLVATTNNKPSIRRRRVPIAGQHDEGGRGLQFVPCTSLGKKKCRRATHCAFNLADKTCSSADLLSNEVPCATLPKKKCSRVPHCAYLSGSCTENGATGVAGETLSQEGKPDGQVVSCAQKNKKQCRRDSNCHWHMEIGCEANVINDNPKNEETPAPANHQTNAPISQPTAPTPITLLYYPKAGSATCVTSPPNGVVTGYSTIEECCAFPWIKDSTSCMINTVEELLWRDDDVSSEPSATPTTAGPTDTKLDVRGNPISPDCYSGRKWHRSRVTAEDSECTNDKNYPSAWNHESMSSYFLFDRPDECCQANFDAINFVYIDEYYTASGAECKVRDVCYLGTEPPTAAPVTNEPTSSEPSALPSSQPSTGPYHLRAGTTCNARWHISRVDSTQNTCTNDSNYPDEWRDKDKRQYFLFQNPFLCCDTVFPGQECHLYNICPEGVEDLAPPSSSPLTPPPTARPSPKPTRLPTRRPTSDDPWYILRATGHCVQSCVGASPCGGMNKWEAEYDTMDECCASQPWKALEECETSPAPSSGSPTTLEPSENPTYSPTTLPPSEPPTTMYPTSSPSTLTPSGSPHDSPSVSPTTKSPTKQPTGRPSRDCSTSKWHMSTAQGDSKTCTNDDIYPQQWLEHATFFFHDTPELCCTAFGFGDQCELREVECNLYDPTPSPSRSPSKEPSALPTSNPSNRPTAAADVCLNPQGEVRRWHMSTVPGEGQTCTNDDRVPPHWKNKAEYFLFETHAACCINFMWPRCEKRDECAGEQPASNDDQSDPNGDDTNTVISKSVRENFEGSSLVLPFQLGSGWTFDDSYGISGKRSIVNIPNESTSVEIDLVLRMTTTGSGVLTCSAKVDIGMPFDRFTLHVNGQHRNSYFRPEAEILTLSANISPGENEIIFRITNGHMFPQFERTRDVGTYGTGYVHIDDCNLNLY